MNENAIRLNDATSEHISKIGNKLLSVHHVYTCIGHETNNLVAVISQTMCCVCENACLRWVVLEIYGFFLSVQRWRQLER